VGSDPSTSSSTISDGWAFGADFAGVLARVRADVEGTEALLCSLGSNGSCGSVVISFLL